MPTFEQQLEERKLRWNQVRFLITALGGTFLFLIGIWQFTITARNDFAKPLLEKQIDLCIDASEAAALLALSDRGAPDWQTGPAAQRYLAHYYGKLGVIEDKCLYLSMVKYKTVIFDNAQTAVTPNRLALAIAFACRRLISRHWSPGLVGFYDPLHLTEALADLDDYRQTMQQIESCKL